MRHLANAVLLSLLFASSLEAKNLYIPVAGVTPGANGTYWRTDLRIFNPSDKDDIQVSLHFLVADTDGRNIPGRIFNIRRGEMLTLENVVAILAPELPSAIGAIRIDSDTNADYDFIATSRTYTPSRTAAGGTYGQFVPALEATEARTKTVVLNVAQTMEVRTNFGAMNPGNSPVTLTARLFGFNGVPFLESAQVVVQPKSMRQWSQAELFGNAYIGDAYVVFEASEPLITWAAVIDNVSGDGIFVRGIEPRAEVRPLFSTNAK